jgi:hypothetical protein
MIRWHLTIAWFFVLFIAQPALAVDPPSLAVAEGKVEKTGKDSLTIQPRAPNGKFGKAITLKFTGTSKVTTVSTQERAGKPVLVQRETEVKDLHANQMIAVIYASAKDGNVLLSAVAQAAAEK